MAPLTGDNLAAPPGSPPDSPPDSRSDPGSEPHGDSVSPWTPLRHGAFRALWIAAVASNLGTWMHNVGAVWLMTSLTPSPLIIALVQTAGSLPIFLMALPAGALADLVDRRRLLLLSQAWMLAAAAGLGLLTVFHLVGPWTLLLFTFLLGIGGALNGPAWQAIMPELVPRSELTGAITLNGAGWNLARAVGPAIGGFIVALSGPAAVFLLNAASFVGVLIVLYRWRRKPRLTVSPAERTLGAIRAGTRYTRHAPDFQAVLMRTGFFVAASTALWALLPVLAKQALHLGSSGYGGLQGAMGVGAVAGAILLPRLRLRFGIDSLVGLSTVVFALVTAALGLLHQFVTVLFVLTFAGVAWTAAMSTLNVAAQTTVPGWVQARALGIYLLVFQGAMAVASAIWGEAARRFGLETTFLIAGAVMLATVLSRLRWRLVDTERLNLARSRHWADPITALEVDPDHGLVLVTSIYRVDAQEAAPFLRAMREVGRARRRSGAVRWNLFRDVADPSRYIETFLVESWAEHLRQHERTTVMDAALEDLALAFHQEDRPIVEHYIYAYDGEEEMGDGAERRESDPAGLPGGVETDSESVRPEM